MSSLPSVSKQASTNIPGLPGTPAALAAAAAAASAAHGSATRIICRNPATGELLGEVPAMDGAEVRARLLRARAAQADWAKTSFSQRREVLRWLFFDNHKFTSYFATYRFMKSFAPTAPDPVVSAWLLGRMDNAFGIVEKHLAERRFIAGQQPTIADMSLCGYLYFPPDESGYDIAGRYPAIVRWLDRLKSALPGWKPPYEMLPGAQVPPRW